MSATAAGCLLYAAAVGGAVLVLSALPWAHQILDILFPVKQPNTAREGQQRQIAMFDNDTNPLGAQTSHVRRDFSQDAYSTAWIKEDGPCSVDLFDYALGENAGAGGFADWPKDGASVFHTNLTTARNIGALLKKGDGCYIVTGFRYVASHDDVAKYATMSLVVGETVIPLGPLRLFAHNGALGMAEGVLWFNDCVLTIPVAQPFHVRIDVCKKGFMGVSFTVQLLRDHAPASI